jgi:hypothetical protein
MHPIDQCAASDIEVLRGARLIPAMFFKRLAQYLAFHLFQIDPVIRQFSSSLMGFARTFLATGLNGD